MDSYYTYTAIQNDIKGFSSFAQLNLHPMTKLTLFLIFGFGVIFTCNAQVDLNDHIYVKSVKYEYKGEEKVGVFPLIQSQDSKINTYKRRFEYLLANRVDVNVYTLNKKLFPDTTEIHRLFINDLNKEETFLSYFQSTLNAIESNDREKSISYSSDDLMKVASKFFYCHNIKPDSTIGSRICIGLNGIKEAEWERDYTLLEAFCFEAIFHYLVDTEGPFLAGSNFESYKSDAVEKHRSNMTDLNEYLENVKLDVFSKMESDTDFKKELLDYYNSVKDTLAFKIEG
jgi:hypothetical protein